MATYSNQNKNTASYSNRTKHSADYDTPYKKGPNKGLTWEKAEQTWEDTPETFQDVKQKDWSYRTKH